MPGTRFGHVRRFDEIDSTNRYLLDEARAGAPEGVVAVADYQTRRPGPAGSALGGAGRGRTCLLSVLLRPALGADAAPPVQLGRWAWPPVDACRAGAPGWSWPSSGRTTSWWRRPQAGRDPGRGGRECPRPDTRSDPRRRGRARAQRELAGRRRRPAARAGRGGRLVAPAGRARPVDRDRAVGLPARGPRALGRRTRSSAAGRARLVADAPVEVRHARPDGPGRAGWREPGRDGASTSPPRATWWSTWTGMSRPCRPATSCTCGRPPRTPRPPGRHGATCNLSGLCDSSSPAVPASSARTSSATGSSSTPTTPSSSTTPSPTPGTGRTSPTSRTGSASSTATSATSTLAWPSRSTTTRSTPIVHFAAESHNSLAVLDPAGSSGPTCSGPRPCSRPPAGAA